MENKIEFNWELYQSGEYDVITRNGIKVEQLNSAIILENDLFLIPKDKEDHSPDVGKLVIPELKGVMMEVSDEEDFENTSQELIIGRLNGLFISNALESWGYARPIKEVKEVWVNVYEDIKGVLYCGDSFKTKEEAIKYCNQAKYIKTIRITNQKDGETN